MTSPETSAPRNTFKAALKAGEVQIGFWQALTSAEVVEISANAGFDWLVLDGEHAPNDMAMIRDQLRATVGGSAHPVVRIVATEDWMIKQVLDIGAQTILVPMVETAEQAAGIVAASRYAPAGKRGVGAALARAAKFGLLSDYIANANDEICVIVQVESVRAVENLDAILAVEGVDGVFIGPADLAADMGFPGRPTAPEVRAVIRETTRRIAAAGRAPGILLAEQSHVDEAREDGALFIAVGSDVGVFRMGALALAKKFKG